MWLEAALGERVRHAGESDLALLSALTAVTGWKRGWVYPASLRESERSLSMLVSHFGVNEMVGVVEKVIGKEE